jgi:Lrp/AsnC family transcriptional regulator for asnA, asnC and gidA
LKGWQIKAGKIGASKKPVTLRLIAELMKNSRRSDRELAKALHVSQPMVTRLRRQLEKEGLIREYTIIPDFRKLGYHIMALTFAKFLNQPTPEILEKAKVVAKEKLGEIGEAILLERGLGLHSNGVVISFHKDYASYSKLRDWLKQFSFIGPYDLEDFLIDLDDEVHYRYLTFSTLGKHLLTIDAKEE